METDKRSVSYSSEIPQYIKDKLKKTALHLAKLLNVRDYSRFDFLMTENEKIYLIDANSLPSLGANYFLEYIDEHHIEQNQLMALLLIVFCKRIHHTYPKCIDDISDKILENII